MSISELIRIPKAKSFHVDISKLDDKTKLVEFLLKEGYINENIYTDAYITDQINLKITGPVKIENDLLKLGIDKIVPTLNFL